MEWNLTPWSCPWPPTLCTPCSGPSGWSEHHENGPKWFHMSKNIGFHTKTKSVACSVPKFQFHPLKLSLASYTSCSWPTWQSVASENGPKWFLILINLEFDTKTKSLSYSEAKLWNSPFISQGAFYSKIGKSELAMDRSKYPISDQPRGFMGQIYYRINQKKIYTNEKIIFEK